MKRIFTVITSLLITLSVFSQRITAELPDSIIEQKFDEEKGWYSTYKTYFTYHENGSLATQQTAVWKEIYNEFMNVNRYVHSDPEDKTISLKEEYSWNKAYKDWILNTSTKKEWDDKGRLVYEHMGEFRKAESAMKRTIQYNDDRVEEELKYLWHVYDKEWVLTEEVKYIYNSNGKITDKKHIIDGDSLLLHYKYQYLEDTVLTEVFYYKYRTGEPDTVRNMTVYDDNGRVVVEEADVKDGVTYNKGYTLESREEIEYNDNGQFVASKIYKKKEGVEDWVLIQDRKSTYYENGSLKDSSLYQIPYLSLEYEQVVPADNFDLVYSATFAENGDKIVETSKDYFSWRDHYTFFWAEDIVLYGIGLNEDWMKRLMEKSIYSFSRGDSVISEFEGGKEIIREEYGWNYEDSVWEQKSHSFYVMDDGERYKYEYGITWVELPSGGSTRTGPYELQGKSLKDTAVTVDGLDSVTNTYWYYIVETDSWELEYEYSIVYDEEGNQIYYKGKDKSEYEHEYSTVYEKYGKPLFSHSGDTDKRRLLIYPLDETVGISGANYSLAHIFPTQAINYIKIQTNCSGKQSLITVVDALGKTVLSVNNYENGNKLNISHLPKGVYLVIVANDCNKYTSQFFKK